ncbi:MAG: RluA family pseudouridine synthase [Tannerellaceae bacterium]|jgi:23S rRNA pseudouridine1911/1915/1917 synthase|nr:RluA family pseudouridine synthase [Tannerellaceae bacterium]
MNIIYEDNHIIALNKSCGEIVQGDKTGDEPLCDQLKDWLKAKYRKPGNVFLGVAHRLDRPVSGVVLFAKTSKALSRINNMFRDGKFKKTYLAIVHTPPPKDEDTLTHWLYRNERQNKTYACDTERPGSKHAILHYKLLACSDNYYLLEIDLKTGRHHQIRSQLSKINCPVKGDLKYGATRTNPNGGISLHASSVEFIHPVSNELVRINAPVPSETLWNSLTTGIFP